MAPAPGRARVCRARQGASAVHQSAFPRGIEGIDTMLSIVSAVLFFIAFLINAADISTNDTFTSTNVMLLGLTVLALHLAGVGSGWSVRSRRR